MPIRKPLPTAHRKNGAKQPLATVADSCRTRIDKNDQAAEWFVALDCPYASEQAIGTGWNHGVSWQDIEVTRQPGGRPTILFHRKAAEFAAKLGAKHIALSLTHTKDFAMAQVILEN